MADLHNLLGDIQSDGEEQDAPQQSTAAIDDEEWDHDRERLDLPPALAEAERKQYQTVEKDKDDDEEEEEGLQEDADYAALKRLWKQEVNTPALQPHDSETIGLFLELLEGQEETIDKISSGDVRNMDPALAPLMASIYKMDADRVRFMLTDFTRTRLDKLEAHPLYMRDMVDRMSNEEVNIVLVERFERDFCFYILFSDTLFYLG